MKLFFLQTHNIGKANTVDKKHGDRLHINNPPLLKSRYLNAIKFCARQTKKSLSANIWGIRKIYKGAFIGTGRNSAKQLIFNKYKLSPKIIEAVHDASLPREFEQQYMIKLFYKKIKHGSQFYLNEHCVFI